MNKKALRRLIIGIILLALLCFGLYLYLNNNRTVVAATSAQLETKTYDVGTPFSGQITSQFVHEGDEVTAGEKLFYIQSAAFSSANASPDTFNHLNLPETKNGEIIITANRAGTVKTIDETQGSFIPANAPLATIAEPDDLRAVAKVQLDPGQYAAINNNSRLIVTLPTGQVVSAKITNINVASNQNQVGIEVTAALKGANYNSRKLIDGAPVSASLKITEPLWQQWF